MVFIGREAVKCYNGWKQYLTNLQNLLPLFVIISFFLISFHDNPFNEVITLSRYQYEMAAMGVFSTWLLQTVLMQNTPTVGLYIEMLKKVSRTFISFFLAYSFLFSAFALSFYILYPGYDAFDTVLPAVMVKVRKNCMILSSVFTSI